MNRRDNDSKREQVEVEHSGIACDMKSNAAVLFDMDGEEQWVPRSLMESYDDRVFWVQRWFAEKEGLDYA